MRRMLRQLWLACFSPLLASCSIIDADQARVCRMVLPALHQDGAILAVESVGYGREPNSIRIAYRRIRPEREPSVHVAVCNFDGGRFSRTRQVLSGLTDDGHPFGEAQLHFLKRFWLGEPATALLAPPLSAEELAHVPQLSGSMAIGLQHLVGALPQIAIYALLAPAYALIYGLIGRVNLAFGELAIIGGQGALIGAIAGSMIGDAAPPLILLGALLLALAAAATHGDLMARAVFVPLANRSGQAVLVASAGLAVGGMEYVRIAQGTGNRWSPPLLNAPVNLARSGDFVVTMTEGAGLATTLALGAALLLLLAMRVSAFGRTWRATADDAGAAALFGIDAKAVLIRAFAIASLLAGLAGFIMTAHYGGIGFSGGLGIGLKALVAAIAGGIGSIGGAIVGAMLIGGFEALWSAYFPLEQAEIAVYSVLVLMLIFRPGGLFGWGDGSPRRV